MEGHATVGMDKPSPVTVLMGVDLINRIVTTSAAAGIKARPRH